MFSGLAPGRGPEALLAEETPFLLAGDYNIIPQAEDAAKPDSWREDALFLPESRAAWRRRSGSGGGCCARRAGRTRCVGSWRGG